MPARYRMANPRDAGFTQARGATEYQGERRNLAADEAALLRVCGRFRTLEQHAAAILGGCSSTPKPAPGLRALARSLLTRVDESVKTVEIISRLEALAAEGFLVSDAALVERLRELARDAPPGCRTSTLGLTTRNRVDCLRRGLASYSENAREFGRSIEAIVIDDSLEESIQQGNQRMLAKLRESHGVAVRYAAARERRQFLEALKAESGVEESIVRFVLFGDPRCPVTTGSSRNCLLLDTAGGSYVLVDDDCVCRLARTPGTESELAFASGNDPTEFWFFANREATLRDVAYEPADFFGVHEAMLGRPLGELIPNGPAAETLDLDRASPAFYNALFEQGGRVRATVGGIIGDSGIGSTAYLSINSRSAARLTPSEEAYRNFVESRQVFRAATQPTVSEGAYCLAGNLGIDNRELLPPFVPVQRNSDGLFARTLRLCDPAAYLAHPAWGCLHDPDKPRSQSVEGYWNDMRRLRFGDLLNLLVGTCPAIDPGVGVVNSLARLGGHLVELGGLSPQEFEAVARAEVARTMERLGDAPRADSGLPRFYAELRDKHRVAMREAAAHSEFVIPRDLDGVAGETTPFAQDLVTRFGQVLHAWPAIMDAARSLKRSAVRLTRSV